MTVTATFDASFAAEKIRSDGAFVVDDNAVGDAASAFFRTGRFRTVEGLDFIAQHSYLNPNIREVIESFVIEPFLGGAKMYNSQLLPTDNIYSFFKEPEIQVTQVTVILLCSTGSRIGLLKGYHKKMLSQKKIDKFGLDYIPHEEIHYKDEESIWMEEGGFIILDGRMRWRFLAGHQIALSYASEAVVRRWTPTQLSDIKELRDKIIELRNKGMRMIIKWITNSS